jgi:hypothetical protein
LGKPVGLDFPTVRLSGLLAKPLSSGEKVEVIPEEVPCEIAGTAGEVGVASVLNTTLLFVATCPHATLCPATSDP